MHKPPRPPKPDAAAAGEPAAICGARPTRFGSGSRLPAVSSEAALKAESILTATIPLPAPVVELVSALLFTLAL
jgi:hypothetical protein